jgi:UDP-3-O-[3-hydroxymyristoyl] glucosamine N-acyltransferase
VVAHPLTTGEVATLTGGRLVGSGDVAVAGVAPLDRAGPGDLSFVASGRYLPYLERSRAAAVLCKPEFADAPGGPAERIVVDDPHQALLAVLPLLHPEPAMDAGVHSTAVIGAGARWEDPVAIGPHAVLGRGVRLGRGVWIGAGCVLGDGVQVGDDTRLYPQVVCYPGTVIGQRVAVHAGARLGSDGFGYVPGEAGAGHRKIPHVGRCVVGDDVEIGANTTVDRGSVDDTVIGNGTKIDNLVQVAHNVRIGARCIIMAQVGISGSCVIEDDCILAGQAGLAGHLTVGRGARVAAQSGVDRSIPAGVTVFGYPARERRESFRTLAAMNRLARIAGRLEDLVAEHGEDPR